MEKQVIFLTSEKIDIKTIQLSIFALDETKHLITKTLIKFDASNYLFSLSLQNAATDTEIKNLVKKCPEAAININAKDFFVILDDTDFLKHRKSKIFMNYKNRFSYPDDITFHEEIFNFFDRIIPKSFSNFPTNVSTESTFKTVENSLVKHGIQVLGISPLKWVIYSIILVSISWLLYFLHNWLYSLEDGFRVLSIFPFLFSYLLFYSTIIYFLILPFSISGHIFLSRSNYLTETIRMWSVIILLFIPLFTFFYSLDGLIIINDLYVEAYGMVDSQIGSILLVLLWIFLLALLIMLGIYILFLIITLWDIYKLSGNGEGIYPNEFLDFFNQLRGGPRNSDSELSYIL